MCGREMIYIANLPIFKYWNLQPNLLHASLDGQKFRTERDNLLGKLIIDYEIEKKIKSLTPENTTSLMVPWIVSLLLKTLKSGSSPLS